MPELAVSASHEAAFVPRRGIDETVIGQVSPRCQETTLIGMRCWNAQRRRKKEVSQDPFHYIKWLRLRYQL